MVFSISHHCETLCGGKRIVFLGQVRRDRVNGLKSGLDVQQSVTLHQRQMNLPSTRASFKAATLIATVESGSVMESLGSVERCHGGGGGGVSRLKSRESLHIYSHLASWRHLLLNWCHLLDKCTNKISSICSCSWPLS